MTRKVVSALSAVVAVAVLAGWTSLAAGDEVRIRAARRYHAVQIQNEDVQLTHPGVQQFMQSDLFRRIVADKKFLRAAWSQQVVRAALGDPELERVRHEINEPPSPGLWRFELERVLLELDGVPWECTTRCRT